MEDIYLHLYMVQVYMYYTLQAYSGCAYASVKVLFGMTLPSMC